jgi:polar amino acid transport system substrate-binding protein
MRRLVLAFAAVLAAALPAVGAAPATQVPGTLTVGLNLPSDGFQVGAASGARVTFARGLEIDLSRALGRQLGLRNITFVQVPRFRSLIAPGPKPWDLALAQVTITPARRRNVDFSVSYLTADQGVLLRRGLSPAPSSIAALAGLKLCAQRDTTSVRVIAERIRPSAAPVLYVGETRLMQALETGQCDAAVLDAPILATLRARAPTRYGLFAGVLRTGERYGVVLPEGSTLTPAVNRALGRLIAQGVVARESQQWLATNLAALPVLR